MQDRHFADGLAEVKPIGFLPRLEGDQRPVAHPRVQAANLKMVIGQGFRAELQGLQTIMEGQIPLVARGALFGPVPFQCLKMLRPQEEAFIPVQG